MADRFTPPYPPSWFDRLTAWVDRLPGPAWAFYLVLGVVVGIAGTSVQWIEGAYPAGTFVPLHLWTFANLAYVLALMHYLDKSAASALATLRPLIVPEARRGQPSRKDEVLFARLSYELTTLPAGPTLLANVVGVVGTVVSYPFQAASGSAPSYLAGIASTPLSTTSAMALFIVGTAIQVVWVYHTIHQLALISRIYTQHARISIYQLQPLYALSVPGAITGIGFMLYLYIWFATTTSMASVIGPAEVAVTMIFAAMSGAAFTLPLLGAHRRLVDEKNRRLAEASSCFEALTEELLRAVDGRRLAKMDPLHKALANLEIVQNSLRRVPTWPWQAGAVRGMFAALLLPVVVWLIQLLLGRVLEG